jgi:hypothetical protein
MVKTLMIVALAASVASPALAKQNAAAEQKAATAAKPEQSPAKAPPEPAPLPVNIKIEVSITDQSGSGTPARKLVSMIASDRQSTNIRSSASVPVPQTVFAKPPRATESDPANVPVQSYTYRNVTINVDARPSIMQKEPHRISLSLGLEYIPRAEGRQEEMTPGMASWSERLSLILESGKSMVVSQAADPTSDRKITVEVTATILK